MNEKPQVLCVDDEPMILRGLELHLRRKFDVVTAESGAGGLTALSERPDTAVILSDMRMPQMNGATFLREARSLAPEAVRMLLSGQSDLNSAIDAINEGRIFRFLLKPCPPDALIEAIDAAVRQHQLVRAERDLLQRTLRGSIQALTEILASSNPVAFGRANRIQRLTTVLLDFLQAKKVRIDERWSVEVAAMVSQLGCIAVPEAVLERAFGDKELAPEEAQLIARIPELTRSFLVNIPRLEPVVELLQWQEQAPRAVRDGPMGARILSVALAYDSHVSRGESPARAVGLMRRRERDYDPRVIDALEDHCTAITGSAVVLPLGQIVRGMVFEEDVRLPSGALLAAHGFEVTDSFAERARGFDGQLRAMLVTVQAPN